MTTPTRSNRSSSVNTPISINGPIVPGRNVDSQDSEIRPLLNSPFSSFNNNNNYNGSNNNNTYDNITRRARSASEISYQSIKEEIVKFSKRRFWWFCGFGIIAIIILHLSFLPRTSLSRDYRRWHGLHLTKNDIKRNYLLYSGENKFEMFNNEQYIDWKLHNILKINSENPTNLYNNNLTQYILDNFQKYGLKTEVNEYPSNLSAPINTTIELFDNTGTVYSKEVLEINTPGYYGFGCNSTVEGNFLFVNNGNDVDYKTLIGEGFDIKDKIVIIKSEISDKKSIVEKVLIGENYGVKGIIHYSNITNKHAIIRDTLIYNFGNLKVPSIPVIPIDVKTLKPILNTINSTTKFFNWNYYPETEKFKIRFQSNFKSSTNNKLKNIIGSIDGIIKDGDIIIGSSRDSFTSSNPSSNNVILLEILRHYSKLIKLGWKPLRNLKFISFDQSKNGLIGSQTFIENYNRNIIAFINLDDDIISGNTFKVLSNPLLNHVIKKVSKLIPISDEFFEENMQNEATELDEDEDEDEEDDGDNDGKTLFKYWKLQDNNTIDNELGKKLINSDSFIFQYHTNTPIMNFKFIGSNEYLPNSNYYNIKFVNKIDSDFKLHNTLIRYLGLLIISLSEHEVINFKTSDYCNIAINKFNNYLKENNYQLNEWKQRPIDSTLNVNNFNTFSDLINNFHHLNSKLLKLSIIFDNYNEILQEGLIQDYPWFQAYKKLKIWAQFKVSNYKLINLDKYLKKEGWFSHLLYNYPLLNDDIDDSLLYDIIKTTKLDNFDGTVDGLLKIYHVFENLNKKMS